MFTSSVKCGCRIVQSHYLPSNTSALLKLIRFNSDYSLLPLKYAYILYCIEYIRSYRLGPHNFWPLKISQFV